MKNILIVSASPREGGNSDLLCDQFARGAAEAGHRVEKVRLAERRIGYCTGCCACQKLHRCVQEDDANELVEKMLSADAVVLATPVYFGSMNAQLKTLIDRCFSRWDDFIRFLGTEFWLILAASEADRAAVEPALAGLRSFLRDGVVVATEGGVICGIGAYEKGAVRNLPAYREAYEAGKSCLAADRKGDRK